MSDFVATAERVKELTLTIPTLFEDADQEKMTDCFNERLSLLQQLQQLVTDESPAYDSEFIALITWLQQTDDKHKSECLSIKSDIQSKLQSQYKNNQAIKQYKACK